MTKDEKSENEGRYDILLNGVGEILIVLKYRAGGPENPRFIYDGGDKAMLYRSRESAIFLDNIHVDARQSLKSVDEIFIVEIEGDEVAREYTVPMRHVKSLEAILQ